MNNWQFKSGSNIMIDIDNQEPMYESNKVYRFKPAPKRTVQIGYQDHYGSWKIKELVAPETVAPEIGLTCYLLGADGFSTQNWENLNCEISWLKAGAIFLTYEDAQAMADWLAVCRKGGAA